MSIEKLVSIVSVTVAVASFGFSVALEINRRSVEKELNEMVNIECVKKTLTDYKSFLQDQNDYNNKVKKVTDSINFPQYNSSTLDEIKRIQLTLNDNRDILINKNKANEYSFNTCKQQISDTTLGLKLPQFNTQRLDEFDHALQGVLQKELYQIIFSQKDSIKNRATLTESLLKYVDGLFADDSLVYGEIIKDCHIRSAPSPASVSVHAQKKGVKCKILSFNELSTWIKIRVDDKEGWAYREYINLPESNIISMCKKN